MNPGLDVMARDLPALPAPDGAGGWEAGRASLISLLADGEYGQLPPPPVGLSYAVTKKTVLTDDAGGTRTWFQIEVMTPGGRFAFPFRLDLPAGDAPAPVFLHLSFFPDSPDPSCPAERLRQRGYGVATLGYGAIAPDRQDGLDELLPARFNASRRDGRGSGAIGYWAWAAQRVLDILTLLPGVDAARIAVIGHSRLGKTALWCGATDERFALVVSVQSGCSGAAVTRGKAGERVANIAATFPHWFCTDYARYAGREQDMPFEQHMLLAAVAPRLLYVCSAQDDQWADPASEFLGCVAASPAWERLGLPGLLAPDAYPEPEAFHPEGRIGYHLRAGGHALHADDWERILDFWDRHAR